MAKTIADQKPQFTKVVPNKWNINVLQYPSTLQTDEQQHYVLFNINVRGKSKLDASKKPLFEVSRHSKSANMSEADLGQASATGGRIAAGVAGFAAGKATGSAITSLTNKATKKVDSSGSVSLYQGVKKAIQENAAGIAGAAVGVAASTAATSFNDMIKPDTMYRIEDAVALYVDAPPSVKYSMNYANKELGTLMGLLKDGVLPALNSFNPLSEKGAALGATAAKIPGMFGAPGDLGATVGKSAGTALNPFKEVVFESVDFRSFSFRYKFLPKSKQESEDIKRIVDRFKTHMHPQMSDSKLFFIYPSEFQITYYFKDKRNEYFHKFRPCALESMEVTYGGDQYSTFADGNPTEVNLSLTFRELEIITRDMIEDQDDGGY